jgi:hypothetical protein
MKLHQVGILLSVFGIVGLTTPNAFNNAHAALTAPSNIDYAFRNNGSTGSWGYYADPSSYGTPNITAYFTRTADGTYYNYTNTFQLDIGLTVTNNFNRSNTNWFSTPSGYIPYLTSRIGSDANVGTLSNKFQIIYNNQTNQDYLLFFDFSSTSSNEINLNVIYNTNQQRLFFNDNYANKSTLKQIYLPAYTLLEISTPSTVGVRYFDAWYLRDLGLSESWYAGYQTGETSVLNSGGMFGVLETVMDATASIFSIPVFGPTITLGTLALFPLIGVVIFFFKKVIQ